MTGVDTSVGHCKDDAEASSPPHVLCSVPSQEIVQIHFHLGKENCNIVAEVENQGQRLQDARFFFSSEKVTV